MNRCKQCRYGFYSGIDNIIGCQYLLQKNEKRGCPAGDGCIRFESTDGKPRKTIERAERKQMKKLTEENKREIAQLAMTGAMTHKAIAEKFGIGKSTVWYLVDRFKKSSETAFDEAVTEDFERFKNALFSV